jgi:hypothetical protein
MNKKSFSGQFEMVEHADENVRAAPVEQKTTVYMVLFSLYIGLAGWIYNFDLGKVHS